MGPTGQKTGGAWCAYHGAVRPHQVGRSIVPRRRYRPAHLDRHRGRLDQVRLARRARYSGAPASPLGLRLEAPPGHHRRGRLDPTRRRADPGQHRRQRASPTPARRAADRGPLRPGRHPVQRPGRPRPLRHRRSPPGRYPPRPLSAYRRWRRGPPGLSQTALGRHRELQRPVQGHLRRAWLGADARPRPYAALRPRRRVPLSGDPALPLAARTRPPGRPQSLPESRLIGKP